MERRQVDENGTEIQNRNDSETDAAENGGGGARGGRNEGGRRGRRGSDGRRPQQERRRRRRKRWQQICGGGGSGGSKMVTAAEGAAAERRRTHARMHARTNTDMHIHRHIRTRTHARRHTHTPEGLEPVPHDRLLGAQLLVVQRQRRHLERPEPGPSIRSIRHGPEVPKFVSMSVCFETHGHAQSIPNVFCRVATNLNAFKI